MKRKHKATRNGEANCSHASAGEKWCSRCRAKKRERNLRYYKNRGALLQNGEVQTLAVETAAREREWSEEALRALRRKWEARF